MLFVGAGGNSLLENGEISFRMLLAIFFWIKLQGTTASSLFLKTDKAVTPCSILILPDVSFGCMTVSGSFINVMDSVCS